VILIADSGSTKCAWKLVSGNGEMNDVITSGINPFFRTTESIYEELLKDLLPFTTQPVEEIFFYGSGIVSEATGNIIRLALNGLYPLSAIHLYSDVLAASRAIFGTSKGIACILGTGSNACLYDGEQVIGGISPLGFILGDEGSGAVIGKKLIGDYFKEVMPLALRTKFEKKFHLTREEALQRVYKTERPNHFLASFTPFLSEVLAEEYAHHLINTSLSEFFDRNVIRIPDYTTYPIGFVGSVAWYFSDLVAEVCEKYNMKCISIRKEPMEGLVNYHLRKPS
jgi:N-acetylglucosamine kinase-like BadF-type ATPase